MSSFPAQTPETSPENPAPDLVAAVHQSPLADDSVLEEIPREDTHAVVMLHGYMSNEQDLLGLAPMLPAGTRLISLRAPLQLAPSGFAWFPLNMDQNGEIEHAPQEAEAAAEQVMAWLAEHAQGFRTLTLLGFSQGMALATLVIQRAVGRPELPRIDAVVGLSGFWLEGDSASAGDQAPPRFFWGRGLADPVISAARVQNTEQGLAAWSARTGAAVAAKRYPRLPHSVSEAEMEDVSEFLSILR